MTLHITIHARVLDTLASETVSEITSIISRAAEVATPNKRGNRNAIIMRFAHSIKTPPGFYCGFKSPHKDERLVYHAHDKKKGTQHIIFKTRKGKSSAAKKSIIQ